MNELFEISGVELASLELFPLVLRGDVSVECVGEEAVVKWNGGNTNKHRIGSSGAFDLIYSGNDESKTHTNCSVKVP